MRDYEHDVVLRNASTEYSFRIFKHDWPMRLDYDYSIYDPEDYDWEDLFFNEIEWQSIFDEPRAISR